MRRFIALISFALVPIAALAGDGEKAATPPPQGWTPPPRPPARARDDAGPTAPAPPQGWTPPPNAPAPIDDERLAEIVDRAVERAMARRERLHAAEPSPQGPVYSSPQYQAPPPTVVRKIVPAEPAPEIAYSPVVEHRTRYAQVLVPPPLHRRALAAVGEKLVACGRPRVRTMRLAPASVQQTIEEAPPRPVYAAPQSYGGFPTLPAKSAPSK